MMHIAIFPTWECQLNCAYCSIRNSQIDRTTAPVRWEMWANALTDVLPRGAIVDIAGGEPLLYEGLPELIEALGNAGLLWAVTTNAKDTKLINALAACIRSLPGCVCFNVSDHSGNPEAHDNIAKLRQAGYRVNVHRVDHPKAGVHEPDAVTITYQDWINGAAVDGIKRKCTAGIDHWVADPQGDMWRCVVALETGQPAAGNLFTRKVRKTSLLCDFGCTSCYTENPASWQVEMRAVT